MMNWVFYLIVLMLLILLGICLVIIYRQKKKCQLLNGRVSNADWNYVCAREMVYLFLGAKRIHEVLKEFYKIKKIAIYGVGYLGDLLFEGLKNGSISILYLVDKNADELVSFYDGLPIVNILGVKKRNTHS